MSSAIHDLNFEPASPRISDLRIDALADLVAQDMVQHDEYLSLHDRRVRYSLMDQVAQKIYEDHGDELVYLIELLTKRDNIDGESRLVNNAKIYIEVQMKKISRIASEKLDEVSKAIAEKELGA